MKQTISEPFTASFTGQLSSFYSSVTKQRYTFTKPLPRVLKDQAYMMELDLQNNRVKLIPVIT